MFRRAAATTFALVALAVPLAGCGDESDASDEAAEKIVEAAGGGDVEVDSKDGTVTVESKEGSFSTGSDLPKDFPKDVKIPKSVEVVGATSAKTPEGKAFNVTGTSKDDVSEVVDAFGSSFKGWTKEDGGSMVLPDSSMESWSKDGQQVSLIVTKGSGKESTAFVLTVAPKVS